MSGGSRIFGRTGRRRGGFTLPELLTATVVMSIALLGVHSVFQRAMAVEARASLGWTQRSSAEAVVDPLADDLEQINRSFQAPPLVLKSSGDGGELICQVGLERRRYSWGRKDRGGLYHLALQRRVFAGKQDLSGGATPETIDNSSAWEAVATTEAGSGMSEFGVQCRLLSDGAGQWRSDYQARIGQGLAVKIGATVGGQEVQRIVVPPSIVTAEEGQE
ncbi:MAG: prepilin-type N-terminal cleavage/methylation domain-containing protein [Phycisphaerae bacterium]|jgi:prepilin-type N-terminal cleavage/methylation domain-containing protein